MRCFISVALLPFEPNDIVEELVVESRGVIGLEDWEQSLKEGGSCDFPGSVMRNFSKMALI